MTDVTQIADVAASPVARPISGLVYFIYEDYNYYNDDTLHFKIGETNRWNNGERLKTLQTGNSHNLKVYLIIHAPDRKKLEKLIHKYVTHGANPSHGRLRPNGEWFRLTKKMIDNLFNYIDNTGLTFLMPNLDNKHK